MKLLSSDLYDFTRALFASKARKKKFFGLEVEMFPFEQIDGAHSRVSLERTLEILTPFFSAEGWLLKDGASSIFRKGEAQFSFEPGGQIEYSSSPQSSFKALRLEVEGVQAKLKVLLQKKGIDLVQTGHDPYTPLSRTSVQLKEKRYQYMFDYFTNLEDSLGTSMMLQTSAIQVCLDMSPDEEVSRKQYILAQALSPFCSALFANSPFVEGVRQEYQSYRSHIWYQTDKTRTGFVFPKGEDLFEAPLESFVKAYLDFALDAHLIFYRQGGDLLPAPQGMSFRAWMESDTHQPPTLEDFERHMSTLFPEVRPKGFLEIRSPDAQKFQNQMVPLAFYAGILNSEETLEKAFTFLKEASLDFSSLRREASRGLSHSKSFSRLARELMSMSLQGFEKNASLWDASETLEDFRRYFETYTSQNHSPSSLS